MANLDRGYTKTKNTVPKIQIRNLKTVLWGNRIFNLPRVSTNNVKNGIDIKSLVFIFIIGDINVNQNLAIALFQNLFLRFHNFLANEIQTINPSWSDEKVYQETRRIMGAVIQVITYNHFLPVLLGKHTNIYGQIIDIGVLCCTVVSEFRLKF